MIEYLLALSLTVGGAFSVRTPRIEPNPLDYEWSATYQVNSKAHWLTSQGRFLYERENGSYYNGRIWSVDATFLVAEEITKEADDVSRQTVSLVWPMTLKKFKVWEWIKKFELAPGGAVTMESYDTQRAVGDGVVKLSYKVPWRESTNEVLFAKIVGTTELEYIEAGVDWRLPIVDRLWLVPLFSYYYQPGYNGDPDTESIQGKLALEVDLFRFNKKNADNKS